MRVMDDSRYATGVRSLLSIGEFSRATSLTVKTLRHYHERGILVPTEVDPSSGYRYYDAQAIERARAIKLLRDVEVPLDEIKAIMAECSDDAEALRFLEAHRDSIVARLQHLQSIAQTLTTVIETEKAALKVSQETFDIEEKIIPPQLVAGIRMTGRFDASGALFKRLGRAMGFGIAGKAGMLIYDEAYKEDGADFEAFFPLRKAKDAGPDIHVRELSGGRALCLRHRGPYDSVNVAYGRLYKAFVERAAHPTVPSREVYLKGPGMFFRGNPAKYLTEIQVFFADDAPS